MLGAINNLDALREWFKSNGKPYFTLRYDTGGNADRIIMRNDNIGDMEEAWELLQSQVISQTGAGRCRLVVFVYEKGKHNNAVYTNIDMTPGLAAGNASAGIAGLPSGIGNIGEYIDTKVQLAKLEWENEQLKDQLSAPVNTFERTWETIAGMPGMAEVFKILAAGVVSRINPAAMPQIQRILNGTPDAAGAETDDEHGQEPPGGMDPQTRFANNINDTAQRLGTDPYTLAAKLRELVTNNPEMAKTILQG